mgnify:CR=1 FL=1
MRTVVIVQVYGLIDKKSNQLIVKVGIKRLNIYPAWINLNLVIGFGWYVIEPTLSSSLPIVSHTWTMCDHWTHTHLITTTENRVGYATYVRGTYSHMNITYIM